MTRKILAVMTSLALVGLMGCGGGDKKTTTTTTPPAGGATTTAAPAGGTSETKKPAAAGAKAYDAAAHKGVIKGVVKADKVYKRPEINLAGNPDCHKLHEGKALLKEEVVTSDAMELQNAVIYIKKGHEGYTYVPLTTPVEIDQVGCQYVPHVAAAMIEQPVHIKNSDNIVHNVHGLSIDKINPEFNISQPKAGLVEKKMFREPEVAYKIKCDVHQHMSTWLAIFDHPFFAVSNDKGAFEIKGVPAGEYEIEIWHEAPNKLDAPQVVKVTVKEDGTTEPADLAVSLKSKE